MSLLQNVLSEALPDLAALLTGQPVTVNVPQETLPLGNTGLEVLGSGSLTIQVKQSTGEAAPPAPVAQAQAPAEKTPANTGHGS